MNILSAAAIILFEDYYKAFLLTFFILLMYEFTKKMHFDPFFMCNLNITYLKNFFYDNLAIVLAF